MRVVILLLFIPFISSAVMAAESCRESAGRKYAEMLVAQCRMVSQATNPPCNTANPCDVILEHVAQSCRMMNDGAPRAQPDARVITDADTAFCKDYLDVAGEVVPSFDCAKAGSLAEKAICGDNELAELDQRLARAFASAARVEAVTPVQQREWLKRRDARCAGDTLCLADVMTERIEELANIEVGRVASGGRATALNVKDLMGRWRVVAVSVYGTGVVAITADDAAYMGAEIEFTDKGIRWLKGTDQTPLSGLDNCEAPPRLSPKPIDAAEVYYEIPNGLHVTCGTEGWGPGSTAGGTAMVRRAGPKTIQLYWYDDAVLALRR